MFEALFQGKAAVRQVALGPRRPHREFRLDEEVERRRRRRLEVEALHRADTAVGPQGDEHQGHGRAVPRQVLVVLPHEATAAVLLGDDLHRGREGPQLVPASAGRVAGAGLVAVEVPPCPRPSEVQLLGLETQPPVRVAVHRATRQGAQRQAEHHDHRQRAGHGTESGQPAASPSGQAVEQAPRQAQHLGHGEGGQEVGAQVIGREDPPVVEPTLGEVDEGEQQQHAGPGEHHAEAASEQHREDGTAQGRDQHRLQRRVVREEVGRQALAVPEVGPEARQLGPGHVVEVVAAPPERQHPERCQQSGQDPRSGQPAQRRTSGAQQEGHAGCDQGEERHQEVAEARQGEEQRRPGPVAARLDPPHHEAYVDEAGGDGEGEGELPRHRRHEVAPHDVERAVEDEQEGRHRQQGGARERQAGEAAQGPAGNRHGDQAGDRHELDRHAVVDGPDEECDASQRPGHRDPPPGPPAEHPDQPCDGQRRHREGQRDEQADIDRHDHEHRHDHVEVVGGESGVPVRGPAG